MSGRLLAFATVLVAFVSLGIGTATAGKLPPAGGNPYSLAGGTLEVDSGTALTLTSSNDTELALNDTTGNPDFTFEENGTRRAFFNYNVVSNILNLYGEESGSTVAITASGQTILTLSTPSVTTTKQIVPSADGDVAFGQWDKRFTNGGFKRKLQGSWDTLTFVDDSGTTTYTNQPSHDTMLVECTHASGCTWDLAATPVGLVTTIVVDSGSYTVTLDDTATHFVGGASSLALSACDVVTLKNDGGGQDWYQTVAVLSLSTCPNTI